LALGGVRVKIPATVLTLVTILNFFAAAQTITVDVSHSVNHFAPNETLGAGVDRIPAEAIDKDLLPPSLQESLYDPPAASVMVIRGRVTTH
jgi:hypothetical protein